MHLLVTCLEQMDLAAAQLHESRPTYARLALLLTDNVVELLVDGACRREIRRDDHLVTMKRWRYDAETRQRVLGRHFQPKVKFCLQIGLIDDEICAFVSIAHDYRNELYHSGMTQEPIIWHLAWEYHAIATRVLVHVYPDMVGRPSNDLSDVARYYMHIADDADTPDQRIETIAKELARARPPRRQPLRQILAAEVLRQVEAIDTTFRLMALDDETLEDILARVHNSARRRRERRAEIAPGGSGHLPARGVKDEPAILNPLPLWRRVAVRIAEAKSPVTALREYHRWRKESAQLIEDIHYAEGEGEAAAHMAMAAQREP